MSISVVPGLGVQIDEEFRYDTGLTKQYTHTNTSPLWEFLVATVKKYYGHIPSIKGMELIRVDINRLGVQYSFTKREKRGGR